MIFKRKEYESPCMNVVATKCERGFATSFYFEPVGDATDNETDEWIQFNAQNDDYEEDTFYNYIACDPRGLLEGGYRGDCSSQATLHNIF